MCMLVLHKRWAQKKHGTCGMNTDNFSKNQIYSGRKPL